MVLKGVDKRKLSASLAKGAILSVNNTYVFGNLSFGYFLYLVLSC